MLQNYCSIFMVSNNNNAMVCLSVYGECLFFFCFFCLILGVEIHKAQKFLQQNFMRDSISKKKLWCGAPRLSRFNRRFGIVKNAQLLSDVDYTCCYEMMNQFSSEIQELSMKSVLNMITHKKWRVLHLQRATWMW